MTRAVWIHAFNGIAGDMTLGALIDAGADVEAVRSELARLDVDGWEFTADTIFRNGIAAVNLTVETDDGSHARNAAQIIELVDGAGLPERVVRRATAIFQALAKAEGKVHQENPNDVHFHEVGGLDAIIDIVGSCIALELLEVDQVFVSPVAQGVGVARSAHGIIPNPAPATVRLLEGIPVVGLEVGVELTTPTGAAIVRALADGFGPLPAMKIESSGFGAGDAELEKHPNILHVVVGELEAVPDDDSATEHLVVVETNVDDLSGEYLAHAVTRLLEAGALDAWLTPIEMKKSRPGVTVSGLVQSIDAHRIGSVLLAETGSIGYRAYGVDRRALDRRVETVTVEGHTIRVKVTATSQKPEFEDVAAAAAALNRPARAVADEALTKLRGLRTENRA